MVGRLSAMVLVCVLVACRGGDDCEVDEVDETPRLDGVCGAMLPLALVIERDPGLPDTVADAAALWPGAFVEDDRAADDYPDGLYGAVTIWRLPLEPGVLGDAAIAQDATGRIIACDVRITSDWPLDPLIVAHELGHCLGLDHSDDEDSVMHSPVRPWSTPTEGDLATALGDDCDP